MPVKKTSLHFLLAGWLLAAGWLVTLPGVLPLGFVVAAWVDGEHGIEVRGAVDDVSVVLTHGAQNAGRTHEQIHRHGLLGRVLTCSAQPSRGAADHVMKFTASSSSTTERKALVLPLDEETGTVAPPVPIDFTVVEVPVPTMAAEYRLAVRSCGVPIFVPAQQHALLI